MPYGCPIILHIWCLRVIRLIRCGKLLAIKCYISQLSPLHPVIPHTVAPSACTHLSLVLHFWQASGARCLVLVYFGLHQVYQPVGLMWLKILANCMANGIQKVKRTAENQDGHTWVQCWQIRKASNESQGNGLTSTPQNVQGLLVIKAFQWLVIHLDNYTVTHARQSSCNNYTTTVEKWLFGFPKLKWLQYTGEVGKCTSC